MGELGEGSDEALVFVWHGEQWKSRRAPSKVRTPVNDWPSYPLFLILLLNDLSIFFRLEQMGRHSFQKFLPWYPLLPASNTLFRLMPLLKAFIPGAFSVAPLSVAAPAAPEWKVLGSFSLVVSYWMSEYLNVIYNLLNKVSKFTLVSKNLTWDLPASQVLEGFNGKINLRFNGSPAQQFVSTLGISFFWVLWSNSI